MFIAAGVVYLQSQHFLVSGLKHFCRCNCLENQRLPFSIPREAACLDTPVVWSLEVNQVWWSNMVLRVKGGGKRHLPCPSPGPILEVPSPPLQYQGQDKVPSSSCFFSPWISHPRPQQSRNLVLSGLDMQVAQGWAKPSSEELLEQRHQVSCGREGGFEDLAHKSFVSQFYQLAC